MFRLDSLEKRSDELHKDKADAKDVTALAEEVKRLRAAFNTLALSIAGSAVVFAFSVLKLVG